MLVLGEALLLPEDMKYWAKWDDDSLLLNIKREAIMIMNLCPSYYCLPHFSISFSKSILSSLCARGTNAPC